MVDDLDKAIDNCFDTFQLESQLLVLDKHKNELHLLNSSASLIFALLQDDISQQDILLREYTEISGLTKLVAQEHIIGAIDQWRN